MNQKMGAKLTVSRLVAVMGIAFVGGLMASRAGAVIIAPGQSLTPNGNGTYSGTKIDDETSGFNSGTFIGSLHSQVYQQSNGWLDFVYQFTNDNINGADAITTFTASSFNLLGIDADYQVIAGDVAPNTVERSPQDTSSDDILSYLFSGVQPGQTSDLLIVQTHATAFTEGSASFLDSVPANAPVPVPVPEPATMGLLATGVVGLMVRRRKAAR